VPTTLNTTYTTTATPGRPNDTTHTGPDIPTLTLGSPGMLEIGNGAAPLVTVTSGLMVTVAFLTAFLVSSLTFSHKISPNDPTLHPALGFCSWTVQLDLFLAFVL